MMAGTKRANEIQIGGDHYKDIAGEEHWDRVARLGLDYFQACITKYVERCWLKNGVEDLKKAQHFIQKYIEISGERLGQKQTDEMVDKGLALLTVKLKNGGTVLDEFETQELFDELRSRGVLSEVELMSRHAEELRRQQDEERRRKEDVPLYGHARGAADTDGTFANTDGTFAEPTVDLEHADEPLLDIRDTRGPMCKECGQYLFHGHAANCHHAGGLINRVDAGARPGDGLPGPTY